MNVKGIIDGSLLVATCVWVYSNIFVVHINPSIFYHFIPQQVTVGGLGDTRYTLAHLSQG